MARKKNKKRNHRIFTTIGVLSALFLLYLGSFFIVPDVAALSRKNPQITAFMEYRKDQWEEAGRKKRITRYWIPYHRISPVMIKAVVISEDAKFWRHKGFDFDAIHNAVERNIKTRTFTLGASTITQQLAKNLYLNPSKNPVRKIKEAILTWRIEKALTKRRILELYLNLIEWGDSIFGIEAASRYYYRTSASDLTARQAATLAAVLPNPIRYNPTSGQRLVVRRSEMIYKILLNQGVIVETAENGKDSLVPLKGSTGVPEPHLNELIDSLIKLNDNTETWFPDSR
ncbi:MAG: monofunctional biosynthetic peptidoglycan transglycosylase [Chitinispirillaceae bacterium]|nr:monofunctional biosynthetic peptidoglycan transglycosylase [Chitinispirillaceae bacterium]